MTKFKVGDLIAYIPTKTVNEGKRTGNGEAWVHLVDDGRAELKVKPRWGGRRRWIKQRNACLLQREK